MNVSWKFVASVLVVMAVAECAVAGCSSDSESGAAEDASAETWEDHGTATNVEAAVDAPTNGALDATLDGANPSVARADGGDGGSDEEGGDAGAEAGASPDSATDTGMEAGDGGLGPEADSMPIEASGSDCGTPTQCILQSQGPDCLPCAEMYCSNPSWSCEVFGAQTATAGPALGMTRESLCLTTLSCIFATYCYGYGPQVDGCYCGTVDRSDCVDSGPPSDAPCLQAEQNGLESTDPGTVFNRILDAGYAAGAANDLVLCVEAYCPGACL